MEDNRKIEVLEAHGIEISNIDGLEYAADEYTSNGEPFKKWILVETIDNVYDFLNY